MADRALRGMTIGAKSMESEDGVEFAERQMITYECPLAHVTTVPMSTEAEVPQTWECPECGQVAALRGEEEPEDDEPKKAPRTHWDMLLERRSCCAPGRSTGGASDRPCARRARRARP